MRVGDVMTRRPVTIRPNRTLRDAGARMLEHKVSGLPVIDDTGRLVGIVTEADFVVQEAERDPATRRRWFGGRRPRKVAEFVSDVMVTKVVTIQAEESVAAAARLMTECRVRRLPVVDGEGRLEGIISRSDVVKSFLREDAEIVKDVDELLTMRLILVDPDEVEVSSTGGVVELSGVVETRADALFLAEVVSLLDGVVRVQNLLRWQIDDQAPVEPWAGYPREGMLP